MELQKDERGNNLVTYFMWYMYNKWNAAEAKIIFGEILGNHIYKKWIDIVRYGDGDQLRFYANLDIVSRNKLVERALYYYDKKPE